MSRWFRLDFLYPRILLSLLAVFFVWLAIHPYIQSSIVNSVESVTGAGVIIDNVRTSFRDNQVQLEGFAVADPHHPQSNLFEANLVDLKLDRAALWRRKVVVKRGRVVGLKVGTQRDQAELMAPHVALQKQPQLAQQFGRLGREWLMNASEQMHAEWPDELRSIQLARDLLEHGPAAYGEMESRTQSLKTRVKALRELLDNAGDNPLRNLTPYQQALTELDGIGREIFEVRGQVDRLQQQMLMDRETIVKARQDDLDGFFTTQTLTSLDPQILSEYLLSGEIAQRLQTILNWIQWSRRYAPTLTARYGLNHQRGRHVTFGRVSAPNILIETLVFQGTGEFGGRTVNLEGDIRGLSSDPRALGSPTEVTIQTTGGTPLLIQAIFDATGDKPKDRITIDCPCLTNDRLVLGNQEQLAVAMSPGDMHLWVNLLMEGESLAGEILMKQKSLKLTPQLHASLGGAELTPIMATAARQVRELDVAVKVGGTITSPTWELRSNLGPSLAAGLRQGIESVIVARRTEEIRQAHAEIDDQLQSAEVQLLAKQQEILESLEFGSTEIERVRNDIATRVDSTDGLVDPDSPLRETLQR